MDYCITSTEPNIINYAIPIIRTIGNICSSSLDRGTELLLKENKFLNLLLQCIQSTSRIIRKESLWALSGLTAGILIYIYIKKGTLTFLFLNIIGQLFLIKGTIKEIDEVINANFIPPICEILQKDTFDIKKEVSSFILNLFYYDSKKK